MSGYAIGWLMAVLAGLGIAATIYGIFRRTRMRRTLWFLVLVIPFVLLMPAPVPGYPGDLAPAFLVALFETLFQPDGKPMVALRLLGIGLIVGIVLASLVVWLGGSLIRGRARPDDERRLPPRRPGPVRSAPAGTTRANR